MMQIWNRTAMVNTKLIALGILKFEPWSEFFSYTYGYDCTLALTMIFFVTSLVLFVKDKSQEEIDW